MRFLSFFKSEETGPPTADEQEAMGKLIAEMSEAGVLLSAEGCLPSSTGFRVRRTGKRISVTDGPFTEAKEVIGGFALLEVGSREEALVWTKRFLDVVGDGETEVRQLCEQPAHRA